MFFLSIWFAKNPMKNMIKSTFCANKYTMNQGKGAEKATFLDE